MEHVIAFIQLIINNITSFNLAGIPIYVILTFIFGLIVLRWVINKLV